MSGTQNLVTVAESGSWPYSQRVTVGRHVLSADEPESVGGHDTGPSSYEFLLAGLDACTAITLRMYAERHNWALRRTTVELQQEKIPTVDGTSKIDHFHRIIYLEGDLTEEQRLRLFEIAEKCPVSETLRHAAIVESKLAGALASRAQR
jgi:putative redox protein